MYKTQVLSLKILEKSYRLHQVTNVDEVFDQLINASPDDEAVKDERIPYWTEIWPSAIGMSEFIIEHKAMFQQKKVIEIGSGLALPSIVASEYAGTITITDYLEDAISFAKINAVENQIHLAEYKILDWRNINLGTTYDIVLASDITYEKRTFEYVPKAIHTLLNHDGVCIIAEPNRSMAKEFYLNELPQHFKVVKCDAKNVMWRGVATTVNIFLIYKQ